jgi:hypothetical protein
VVLDVVLAGFFGVMCGVVEMTLSNMGVVPGFLMITPFMMLGCGQMVLRGVFMMFCRLAMVLCGFLGHGSAPLRDLCKRSSSTNCWGSMNPGSILTAAYYGSITPG